MQFVGMRCGVRSKRCPALEIEQAETVIEKDATGFPLVTLSGRIK